MPTIVLLTAEILPHDDHETHLVAEALGDLGIDAPIVPWTEPNLSSRRADLALLRSTWDYTSRLTHFLAALTALPMPLVNELAVVRWNAHKGYLTELALAGVPVVPTHLLPSPAGPDDAAGLLGAFGASQVVIKPAVSAGARGIGRFAADSPAAVQHLQAIVRTSDALVQPFQESVVGGERSLIFLAGRYSHAVRKRPAPGDFRVQEQYGGTFSPHAASDAELAVARLALAGAPGGASGLLYARVDLVGPESAPLVMELELIEPELFLPYAAGSAAALAQAAAALL